MCITEWSHPVLAPCVQEKEEVEEEGGDHDEYSCVREEKEGDDDDYIRPSHQGLMQC